MRAIPNMRVFRPCDAIEVTECWELALNRIDGPTVLVLTRQNLPQLRTSAPNESPCRHGAYELVAAQGEAKVSLFASGSEVEIAVAAQKQLAERGIAARVVSVAALALHTAQQAPLRPHRLCGATQAIETGYQRRTTIWQSGSRSTDLAVLAAMSCAPSTKPNATTSRSSPSTIS